MKNFINLKTLGWNNILNMQFAKFQINGFKPARVSSEQKNSYKVITENGEFIAKMSDKLWFETFDRSELPVVGDWVAVSNLDKMENIIIQNVLPRKSKFSRKALDSYGRNFSKEGISEEQILSANIDIVALVIALDDDFNLRKIERYMTLMWDSGAEPVIILNKTDDCHNYAKFVKKVENISNGIPVYAISAKENYGLENLLKYIKPGKTISFIGSSGVGKSTIINRILGEDRMLVYEIRDADHRGRHTTTHRQLLLLPDGGILIDNPGMRDIKVIGDPKNLNRTFQDIVSLSNNCRFRNCNHHQEPGCAVREAISLGKLAEKRLDNFLKLKRDMENLEKRRLKRKIYLDNTRSKQRVLGEKSKIHRGKKYRP